MKKNRILITCQLLFFCLTVGLIIISGITGCSDEPTTGPLIPQSRSLLAIAGSSTLTLYDLEMNTILDGHLGLGNAPNWIESNAEHLYVINSMSNDICVFRYTEESIDFDGIFDLGLAYNRNPYAAAWLDQEKLAITNLRENTVSVYNTLTNTVEQTWPVGTSPEGILVKDDFCYVIATGYDFSNYEYHYGKLYKLSRTTGEMVDSIPLGYNPQFIASDLDDRLYITCTGNYDDIVGRIHVIEVSAFRLYGILELSEGYPGRLEIAPDGSLYIAAGGWASEENEYGVVLHWIPFANSPVEEIYVGLGATDIAIQDRTDGYSVFVACSEDNCIYEIRDSEVYSVIPLEESPYDVHIWNSYIPDE